ncbi:phosphatidylethanolamine-binding protein [Diplogelasinospora grovesii]|uniref:Phosphatidylethanolamine-binding protein n=1 Tax=Diplogelasinospora grovesii TaxID=303347 RepID=A0AAN6NCK9_9PEZI|nr:phosphatidylethanolamine-binding protein [Diplogelasinospora grovesii]
MFKLLTSAAAILLTVAGLASAQTPPGFSPEVTARLEIIFGTKSVMTPGQSMTKAETAKQPTVGISDSPTSLSGTYLWMMIDQDVPANFQNPSAGGRRTNLHAMISGFKMSGANTTITMSDGTPMAVYTLTSTATGPVAYVGPVPPAETPAHPHRYVNLLYETPKDFAVTKAQVGQTLGFNLTQFVAANGLGLPVRGNWFNVTA